MSWGIEFTAYISRCAKVEIEHKIEMLVKLQEYQKAELYIMAASTPVDTIDETGEFVHRNNYVMGKSVDLWRSIIETSGELALLRAALDANDVKDC